MRKAFLVVGFCTFFSLLNLCLMANEWVEMGPLNGSAEGHVWSKVVDEVGNTKGRNEVWQLSLPCPASLDITVRCPDPYSLEVVFEYRHAHHGILEFKPDRIADGFSKKGLNLREDKLITNMKIKVYSRKPSTDQRYQLIVDMKTLDGKPVPAKGSASSGGTATTAPKSAVKLIRTLHVIEYERDKSSPAWNGVMNRIGESSNFQATWKSVRTGQPDKATLTMQSKVGDRQVILVRPENGQTYTGTISSDGLTLEGTFNEPGKAVRDRRWTARIEY